MKNDKTIIRIIGLGIISGMRATFASAIAAHFLGKEKNHALASSKLGFIQSPTASVITKLMCAGEIVGDKLPNTSDRIIASGLIGRVTAGAFVGAVISTANKESIAKGVLLGSASALAATYGTFYLRKYIAENTVVKEPLTGVFEDAIAIGTGVLLMR